MALNLNLRVSLNADAQLSYTLTCAYHMEEVTCKVVHIYIEVVLCIKSIRVGEKDLSHGLGADISLPHCLATGI